jgi:transcriptional regulator with XRE-family HTH domain
MEIPTELIENWICDLRKKEIEPIRRAQILRAFLDEKKISARELARRCNIGHSTIDDWLRWEQLQKEQLKELKAVGHTNTEIYRALREHKIGDDLKFTPTSKPDTELDRQLNICEKKLIFFKIKPPYSKNSLLLDQIENAIMVQKR